MKKNDFIDIYQEEIDSALEEHSTAPEGYVEQLLEMHTIWQRARDDSDFEEQMEVAGYGPEY